MVDNSTTPSNYLNTLKMDRYFSVSDNRIMKENNDSSLGYLKRIKESEVLDRMESLLLVTERDLKKLMGMMYLDIGKYSFVETDEGLLIELNEVNPASLNAFIKRFASWFSDELFIENGNRFFSEHNLNEKWDIWKKDFRFIEAYQDELYLTSVLKRLEEFFSDFDLYDSVELDVDMLFAEFYDITNVRMEVIKEHFKEDIHENYITLCLASQIKKESVTQD